jgi:cystathionine gamma-synthase
VDKKLRIETRAVHAGNHVDPATGAVAPAIQLSTTFERDEAGQFSRGFNYARYDNPNRRALEQAVAAIEGGAGAAAFSSGSAATAAVLQTLKPGDRILAPDNQYHGTTKLMRNLFGRWQITADFVDMTDLAQVESALRSEPKIVWAETPSNPLLKIVDLAAVAQMAKNAGAISVCDNTWAPVIQRPFDCGFDVVMHSTTKYMGGHSDVLGGVIVSREENAWFQSLREIQSSGGAVPAPFDCWLVARGLRTLPWRMRAHCQNAEEVATFLSKHPRIEFVHYPGLSSHARHEIAAKQMSQFGGMLSFQVRGSAEDAIAVAAKTRIFTRATSLGGVESLIEHRASAEGPETRTPGNLLRVSVGLENAEDLKNDFEQALS